MRPPRGDEAAMSLVGISTDLPAEATPTAERRARAIFIVMVLVVGRDAFDRCWKQLDFLFLCGEEAFGRLEEKVWRVV